MVGEPNTRSEPFIQFGAEHWLLNATPYLLPGRLGAELVTSEPPDPELVTRIRLPYETVLVFFDELDLDHLGFLEITATWTAQTDDEPVTVPVGPPTRTVLGVVLAANPDGHLLPWVQWIIAEHHPGRGTAIGPITGIWQRSEYAGVIANIAAVCTWGEWSEPLPLPAPVTGDENSREWRRSLERSGARRAIQRGALSDVRVLYLDPAAQPEPAGDPTAAHPSAGTRHVRTHWRSGHWQRYRVATRDAAGTIIGTRFGEQGTDWHYEGRWVRPTLVKAAPKPDPTTPATKIYVITPTAPPGGETST